MIDARALHRFVCFPLIFSLLKKARSLSFTILCGSQDAELQAKALAEQEAFRCDFVEPVMKKHLQDGPL